MKVELQQILFQTYPKIFRQKSLPMSETCMCWGIECGDGWFILLDGLCKNIQTYLDCYPEINQVEATQVKEKFGGLCFYFEGGDKYIWELISQAESQSYKTCERCGSTEKVSQTKGGWILSLCELCKNKKS